MNSYLPGETFLPVAATPGQRLTRNVLAVGIFLLLAAIALTVGGPTSVEYRLGPRELAVRARMGLIAEGRTVELARLVAAQPAVLGAGVRLFGSNAPGYCVGTFRYERLGTVWQATGCGRRVVVLETAGEGLVVIEPESADSFLDALYARTPSIYRPPAAPPKGAWLAFQGVIWLLPVITGAIFFLVGRDLRYRVHDGFLIVSTALGGRHYELRGAKARRVRPRSRVRGFGAGMPGYYGGRYLINGRMTMTAVTRLDEGVLIEHADYRLFVNPADVTGFMRAVQENRAEVAA
jgi:hypothetical protein